MIRPWWARLLRRPGIQRHYVQRFDPQMRPVSEYDAEEQRILAAAALQPDSLPDLAELAPHDAIPNAEHGYPEAAVEELNRWWALPAWEDAS